VPLDSPATLGSAFQACAKTAIAIFASVKNAVVAGHVLRWIGIGRNERTPLKSTIPTPSCGSSAKRRVMSRAGDGV
jgi:hypothetical protein